MPEEGWQGSQFTSGLRPEPSSQSYDTLIPSPPVAGFLPTSTGPGAPSQTESKAAFPRPAAHGPAPRFPGTMPATSTLFSQVLTAPGLSFPSRRTHRVKVRPECPHHCFPWHWAHRPEGSRPGRGRGCMVGCQPLVCLGVGGASRPPWDLGAEGAGVGGTYSEPASTLGPRT